MTKKEERKLIKIFGINPGLVVRDATMWVVHKDSGLNDLKGWNETKDGDMVAVVSFKWRNAELKKMTRDQMYRKLSEALGHEVHVAWADIDECERIMEAAKRL